MASVALHRQTPCFVGRAQCARLFFGNGSIGLFVQEDSFVTGDYDVFADAHRKMDFRLSSGPESDFNVHFNDANVVDFSFDIF